jgi:outer membrane protein assembly factor BamB
LSQQWSRALPELEPAWPEDPRISFDVAYEPIVVGKLIIIGSSYNDTVTVYETEIGREKWRIHTDGPVRFAPVAIDGRLYFGSDDGFFYCVNATDGKSIWKFRAAPNDRRAIGNSRLISVWPMRGGPIHVDGKLYFTFGVWPFEGTFLYTLDVAASKTKPKFAVRTIDQLTPQGYLATGGGRLYIPCGRSVVGVLDLKTDKFLKISYGTRGTTTTHATAIDSWLFHGAVSYHFGQKNQASIAAVRPVFTKDTVYYGNKSGVFSTDLVNSKIVDTKDRRGKIVKKAVHPERWRLSSANLHGKALPKPLADLSIRIDVKADARLFGHQGNQLFAIDLPADHAAPQGAFWTDTVDGDISSMLVADNKLFVVTREGGIHCFAKTKSEPIAHKTSATPIALQDDRWSTRAAAMLAQAGTKSGIAVVLGVGSGRLIDELVTQSQLQLILIDADHKKVDALRNRYVAAGLYGTRLVAQPGNPATFVLPPYLANLVTSEDISAAGFSQAGLFAQRVYPVLRPYGGVTMFQSADNGEGLLRVVKTLNLPKAEVKAQNGLVVLRRVGALQGAANWTHEYGNPSNSLMSQDKLVKAPLGVLWFGGPASSGDLFYNRHYWGPSMAVVGGRMFIQGPGKMTAVDVYTGRILWQTPIKQEKENNPDRAGNDFERVLAGFHFLVVEDGMYIANRKSCLRLDPATGKLLATFTLPDKEAEWGRIRVWKETLIVNSYRDVKGKGKLPTDLVAMDRRNGKVLWKKTSTESFPFVAVGNGKVYAIDGYLEKIYTAWKRRGLVPQTGSILYVKAFDARTGKVVWERTTERVVTWLAYSAAYDVLVTSNKKGLDGIRGSDGKELWQKTAEGRGFRGHPENLWDKVILWKDRILDQRGPGAAYDLKTGKAITRIDPITKKPVAWNFTKSGHHCNYAIASTHLMTFRAADAGFTDIKSGTTGRLKGFRSGCRNSLIPADGVLNAPNFAHGCSCGYSLFTSLALVHLPKTELWTYSALAASTGPVERLGINLGAPGDRMAEDGTLWLDYPNVGGSSPGHAVTVAGKSPRYFRHHSALVEGDGPTWIAASGVEGATSVKVALGKPEAGKSKRYTVRLFFAEPDEMNTGERVFGVSLQGREVLSKFDVSKVAGGSRRIVVRTFKDVDAVDTLDTLDITLTAIKGKPILCGVEVIAAAE